MRTWNLMSNFEPAWGQFFSKASHNENKIQILWYNRIFTPDIETDAKKGFIGPEIGFYLKIYNFHSIIMKLGKKCSTYG